MKRNHDLGAAIDERLAAAVEQANYRITLNNQKENARSKLRVDMTHATSGGLFVITPELISFTHTLLTIGQTDAVIVDINKNPIFIENLQEFQNQIVTVYYSAMNDFLLEFKRIQKARKPEKLVE